MDNTNMSLKTRVSEVLGTLTINIDNILAFILCFFLIKGLFWLSAGAHNIIDIVDTPKIIYSSIDGIFIYFINCILKYIVSNFIINSNYKYFIVRTKAW